MESATVCIHIIVVFLVLVPIHETNACSDEMVLEQMTDCKDITGFDESHCENLECYLACMMGYLSDCTRQDRYHHLDPRVYRVRQRALCNYSQGHEFAMSTCQVRENSCHEEDKVFKTALEQDVEYHILLADFENFKTISCRLDSLIKACTFVPIRGDCTADLAAYVTDFHLLNASSAACNDPQDTPLFSQFGGEINCTGNLSRMFELNVTTSPTPTDATTTTDPEVSSTTFSGMTSINITILETPEHCEVSAIEERRANLNCQELNVPFSIEEAETFCTHLECNLACFEEFLLDCDTFNINYNRMAYRLWNRIVCNRTATGHLAEYYDIVEARGGCIETQCFTLYFELLTRPNVLYEHICRYLDNVRSCQPYYITHTCPKLMGQVRRDLIYGECEPERNPYYTEYGHEPECKPRSTTVVMTTIPSKANGICFERGINLIVLLIFLKFI